MHRLWLVMTVGLAACAAEPQVTLTTQETGGGDPQCPNWYCGGNTPILGTHVAREFALDGTQNAERLSLETENGRAQISKDGSNYDLVFKEGRIVGQSHSSDADLAGDTLEGAQIVVLLDNAPAYRLVIARASTVQFAVGTPDEFEAYKLTWDDYDATGTYKLLCNEPPDEKGSPDKSPELLGLPRDASIVFLGDRIDDKHRAFVGYDKNWFNIGCATDVLAKTFLTRSTTQSKDEVHAPWWGQREFQATLKMYSADYCGTGRAFTIAGQHMVFADDAGIVTYWADPSKYEARWKAEGATCLDRPRRIDDEPDIREQIDKECRENGGGVLPPCYGDDSYSDFDNTSRISAYSVFNP